MPYAALATDYDGTIARDGAVDGPTLAALARLRAAGWRLVLATGRGLDDLRRLMPRLDLFDRVVAEDGAVLHAPATGAVRLLARPLPPAFAAALAKARQHTPPRAHTRCPRHNQNIGDYERNGAPPAVGLCGRMR